MRRRAPDEAVAFAFVSAFPVRLDKTIDKLTGLLIDFGDLVSVAPDREVEPGGIVTDRINDARGALECALIMLQRAQEEVVEIRAKRAPAGKPL